MFFEYAIVLVGCPECGVAVDKVPCCDRKNQLTTTCCWFPARWAKKLSWQSAERG